MNVAAAQHRLIKQTQVSRICILLRQFPHVLGLQECPTWWRLYEYVNKEDRNQLLVLRRTKQDMKLGEGGEGYIANDKWCYNCGSSGHWGDVCVRDVLLPHSLTFP